MVPYLQPSGQAMVGLKLWLQSDLLKVTKVRLLPLLFLFFFSQQYALFCVTDHTTKLGMKDLLKDQQWWVERDSNLIPLRPLYAQTVRYNFARWSMTFVSCCSFLNKLSSTCKCFHVYFWWDRYWHSKEALQLAAHSTPFHKMFPTLPPTVWAQKLAAW